MAAIDGVPDEVGEVRDLELVRVDTDVRRRIWNTLMAREHPRGAGPCVPPDALSGRFGTRVAGRGGFRGLGAMTLRARRLDRVG